MTTATYEMLWDCKFCGAQKLLGFTHRHCPNCGAPQNAQERYFPSEAEQTPVAEHVYYGVDVVCAHCQQANSKNSKHCGGCGGALEGMPEVARRADQIMGVDTFSGQSSAQVREQQLTAQPVAGPTKSRSRVVAIVCLSMAAVALVLGLTLSWKKSSSFVVTGHTWQRGIAIERFGPVSDSAWCDSLPRNAHDVSSHREVRSTRRVPDGQTCHTRRRDNGNGTFSSRRECKTRYRRQDVYDDRCRFSVDRWTKVRDAIATGTSPESLQWPATKLSHVGECLGCERDGRRTESYQVRLADAAADEQTCSFDERRWRAFEDGSRWQAQVRVVGHAIDCGSLAVE